MNPFKWPWCDSGGEAQPIVEWMLYPDKEGTYTLKRINSFGVYEAEAFGVSGEKQALKIIKNMERPIIALTPPAPAREEGQQ